MDFSKTNVVSAAVNHSKIDVSSTHITTSSFMELQPVYYRHMLPGEHIKGSGSVLSRLAPLQVPTYGRCRINMRSFFVPFRTVFPNFNEFIVDTIASDNSSTSLVTGSPIIESTEILTFFLSSTDPNNGDPLVSKLDATDPVDAAAIAAGAYDFILTSEYYVFGTAGRRYLKILESLGYRLILDGKDDVVYSALPLLCYAKVFIDWYANSAYLNRQLYTDIMQMFKFIDPTSNLNVDSTLLGKIMELVEYITYDSANDVYLNAWDNPVSPNNGLNSSLSMKDITLDTTLAYSPTPSAFIKDMRVGMHTNGTPYTQSTYFSSSNTDRDGVGFSATEYIHQALKAMTDYVKRNQLSGAYQIDRFLSRFGLNLDSSKVDRSIYIGASSVDVDFGSVMQTANTAGSGNVSNLGDYAGQGLGRGEIGFDFKCDEFGLFIVLSSIVPAGHLYQGFDRNLLHIGKMDFYQPEFDNLGCQAIAKGEVYVSRNDAYANSIGYQGVYGYAPRYYEYKQKQDFVTGDFVSPATMQGGDAWHLNRELSDSSFGSIINQTHGFRFTYGIDSSTYDRIFQYTNPDVDKFYLVYHFAAESLCPCKSLFDTYDFDEVGKTLTLDAGGAKAN